MDVDVICSNCQTLTTLESNDYPIDIEAEEAGMGTKVERWTNIETTCECGQSIEVTLHETEYPEGDFQGTNVAESSGVDSVVFR